MYLPERYFEPAEFDQKKAKGFIISSAIIFPLYILFLWYVWYMDTERTSFHFFNDFGEWLQMDKVGHFTTHAQWAVMPTFIFLWSGYKLEKAALYSFLYSLTILLPIEIMDGFAVKWGFSVGDVLANTLGSLFMYVQLVGFKRVVAFPKFSFHQTAYALMRPDMFGHEYIQNSLKDYNGQTYWISLDVNRLIGKKILPSWLLLSIGYGAEGMYGGHANVWTDGNGVTHDFSNVERYRQFYLSFDINFSHLIKTKNKVVQVVLYPILNIHKFPFPALEFSERGVVFHWLYF